jgi:hypothetical protein
MTGGGFIAAAGGAASPVGVVTALGSSTAALVEGAASDSHRPKYREESANVRTNAPAASPHRSIRLSKSTPMKKS